VTVPYILALVATHFFFVGYHSSANVLVPEALLGVPVGLAGFVLGVFGFAGVITRPLTGGLLNLGRRQLWIRLGAIGIIVAFIGYSFAPGPWPMVPFRILHGAAMGFFATGLLSLVAEMLPDSRRGLGLGIFYTANTLALFYAPSFLKHVTDTFSIEAAFMVAAGSTLIALISASLIGDPLQIKAKPLTNIGYLINPINGIAKSALLPMLIFLSTATGYMAITGLLPQLAESKSIENYTTFWQAAALGQLACRALVGWLSDRFGRGTILLPTLLLMTAGLVNLAYADTANALLLSGLFVGLGNAGVQVIIAALIVDRAPPSELASSLATYTLAWDFGAILGQTGFSFLIIALGIEKVFLVLAVLPVLAIFLYWKKIRIPRPDSSRVVTS
jgi:MFS family permease